jgi:hypothetical protein
MRDMLTENLRAYFAGQPVPNPVKGFEQLMAKP